MRWFALLSKDGALCQQVTSADIQAAARENDWEVGLISPVDRVGDTQVEVLQDGVWESDLIALENLLLAEVEAVYMLALSGAATPGKESVYQAKSDEVARWTAGMSGAAQLPFAAAEAELTGQSIEEVIFGFLVGMEQSRAQLATIEAAWQSGRHAIRDARGAEDKRAIAMHIKEKLGGSN